MNHSTEQRKGKPSKAVTAEEQADWRDNGKGLRRDVVQNSKEGPQAPHTLRQALLHSYRHQKVPHLG